ncbi:MAG: RecQ family zinc-binding domain-containing protein, partial [Actinobacteria bacterium]|nr:RecQ family zinc-binding domain-containing protein [Actinomycetota bacterium]
SWGHDFRPDYLRLGAVAEALGRPRIVALTATATRPVRDELVERLGLRDPLVLVQGFDRPELLLAVERFADDDAKRAALCDRVEAAAGPGIVYAATRARVVELAETLRSRGLRAAAYHGGLPAGERDAVQDGFMAGALDVVVATTAFGMGIDKEDVRFVFHAEPSDSLDSYYQEIGRAGRDGARAEAVLFYRPEDLGVRRFFAGGARIEEEELAHLVRVVQERGAVPLDELAAELDMSAARAATAVGWLERDDVVQVQADGVVVAVDHDADAEEAAGAAADAAEARRRTDASRVEMMRAYAETRQCRRRFLLNYLGEPYEPPCDTCDVCLSGRDTPVAVDGPFAIGESVVHESFGRGAVTGYEADKVVVLFDDLGYRTLLLDHVMSSGMLQAED